MSFFTTIYIVAVESTGQMLQSRAWYWDRTEATDSYNEAVDEFGDTRIVTLYSIDMQGHIEEAVNGFMANRHSSVNRPPLEELRSSRPAKTEPKAEYSELQYSFDETELYIERTLGGDCWQYRILKPADGWHVRDMPIFGGARLGAIYLDKPNGLMPEYVFEREAGQPLGCRSSLREAVIGLLEWDHSE